MLDYETLRLIWWLLLGVLLVGFAVTDGYDLGVGALFRFVGRTDEERRVLLATIEPNWEGNQVWFILGGGAVFAAWPLLYAASFSGLYLALFLVLVALILRPVGFTYRDKLTNHTWRETWDWALCIGGALPALLFGVAFGNLFLGVDFHYDDLRRSIVTGSFFSLLHPFALLSGIISLSMLVMHGATFAAMRADTSLAPRLRRWGMLAALLFTVTFLVAGLWLAQSLPGHVITAGADPAGPSNPVSKTVAVIVGAWLGNYAAHPVLYAVPGLATAAALLAALLLQRGRDGFAFVASGLAVASTIFTAGIALFPFLMPSRTQPGHGLTIWDASSSRGTLLIMLIAVIVFLPIVLAYSAWAFRVMRGRVTLAAVREHAGYDP